MAPIKTPSGDFGDFTVHVVGDIRDVPVFDTDLTDYDEEMDELEVTSWNVEVVCPRCHTANAFAKGWGKRQCSCGQRIDIHVSAYSPSVTPATVDGQDVPVAPHPGFRSHPSLIPEQNPDDMAERIELVEEVNTLRDRNDTLLDIIRELRDRVKGMQG